MEHNKNIDRDEIDTEGWHAGEGERSSFPPGHPVSWGALIRGTILAGVAYPGLGTPNRIAAGRDAA